MNQKSAAELEREAEAARGRMTETAHELQNRISPGQIIDELQNYFKNSDGTVAFHNLKAQVRDNPLPLALVGTGLAWLMMGGGATAGRIARIRSESGMRPDGPARGTGAVWGDATKLPETGMAAMPIGEREKGTSASGKMGGAVKSASQTVGSISEKAGSAYSSASDKASSMFHSMAEGAHGIRQRTGETGHYARDAGSRMQRMFGNTLEQEPLIIGALGLAVGAAIGAMLPRTRMEEEYVAPHGERLRENVQETARQGMEQAESVASRAVEAGRDEIERQSSASTGPSQDAPQSAKAGKTPAENRPGTASSSPQSSGPKEKR